MHPQLRPLTEQMMFSGEFMEKLSPGRKHETNFIIRTDPVRAFVERFRDCL